MARPVTVTVHCEGATVAPAIDIQRLALRQTIFGHHSLELAAPFDRAESSLTGFFNQAPKRLLGKALEVQFEADAFHFNQGQRLQFKGVATRLEAGRSTEHAGSFVLWGYSPCYLLASGFKKRTFLNQTLTSIFQQVLQPFDAKLLACTLQPLHTAPLPYVVQYRETNYDFLSRLAAEYGEWFYYDGTTLRLGPPPADDVLEFVADGTYNGFAFGLGLKPTSARLYDYNYERHERQVSASQAQAVPQVEQHRYSNLALQQSEVLFPDAAHVAAETRGQHPNELGQEARLYKAYAAADLVTVEGYSDNPALQLGGVINITGKGLGTFHQLPENFGLYRLVELTHFVDSKSVYSNRFVAVPHLLDVAPLHPFYDAPAGAPELAEVIDTHDPQRLGRVRVRYYWPVDQPQQAETDWLRVLTPYSGTGKGQLFTPEVGSQVLLGYEDGLAGQPYVQGNLFHAQNPQGAAYTTPENRLKGLQTAGGNKFVMSDVPGGQTILISNSNKKSTAIALSFAGDGSISITTNGPINITSGDDIHIAAKKNITLRAGEDIVLAADKNILAETKDESIGLRAKKELLLTATDEDLTLEAGSSKVVVKAADNVELAAGNTAKIMGSDIKLSQSS